MHDHPLYTNPSFGIVRGLQMIFNIVIIGLVASEFSTWKQSDCKTPSRVIANLALAAISFPLVLYQLITASPFNKCLRFIPWNRFATLAVDILLVIVWVIAGALSSPNCSDLCKACTQYALDNLLDFYTVTSGSTLCSCEILSNNQKLKRGDDILGATMTMVRRRVSRSSSRSTSKYSAKLGFDWLMFAFCLIALVLTVIFIFVSRNRTAATSTAPIAGDVQTEKPTTAPVYNPPAGAPGVYPTPPPPGGSTYPPAAAYPQQTYLTSPAPSGYTAPSAFTNSPPPQGYTPAGQPGYAHMGQPGYAPAGQPGYAPNGGEPGYASAGSPVYSSTGQPGYAPASAPYPGAPAPYAPPSSPPVQEYHQTPAAPHPQHPPQQPYMGPNA